jgi:hypothetical protein
MPTVMKIRSLGADLFHADKRTDGQAERRSNFTHAPKHNMNERRVNQATEEEELGKSARQPRGLILTRRKLSRKVRTVVLKWTITKGRNTEHTGL